MSSETVQRHTEGGDVKDVPDEKALTVQRDDGRAPPQDWSIRVVAHPNTKVADRLVRDEGRPIWKHVVRGPSIRHNETERITRRDGSEDIRSSSMSLTALKLVCFNSSVHVTDSLMSFSH